MNYFQNNSRILFTFFFIFSIFSANAQIQKGSDIVGKVSGDGAGSSVSMPDAYTIAIGGFNNNVQGHVRVYHWDRNVWAQKGSDIDVEACYGQPGIFVSMPDANVLAIGVGALTSLYDSSAGYVRVYKWNGKAWTQKGLDIIGETAGDHAGISVSMPDSNTIAIGAEHNDGKGTNSGHVRVYNWSGNMWSKIGSDIDGESADDNSGRSVSMPDSNTVAIGAPGNDGNGEKSGQVRVYRKNSNTWVQKGADINGETDNDVLGAAVSMPDANTVGVGARFNSGIGDFAGCVRIYRWKDTSWVKKGADIVGDSSFDYSGFSVSMPDSNNIAIGAPANDVNGKEAGQVRVYHWNGAAWIQIGSALYGSKSGAWSGWSVSMPNEYTLAIGTPGYSNRADSGVVRVYGTCNIDYSIDSIISIQPADQVANVNDSALFNIKSNNNKIKYQWQSNNGFGFVNLINSSLYSNVNGDSLKILNVTIGNNMQPFRCIVADNNCLDTSQTAILKVFKKTNVDDDLRQNLLFIYPNPANRLINVKAIAPCVGSSYLIEDYTGKVVLSGKLTSEDTIIYLADMPAGNYVFRLLGKGDLNQPYQTFRVIKK